MKFKLTKENLAKALQLDLVGFVEMLFKERFDENGCLEVEGEPVEKIIKIAKAAYRPRGANSRWSITDDYFDNADEARQFVQAKITHLADTVVVWPAPSEHSYYIPENAVDEALAFEEGKDIPLDKPKKLLAPAIVMTKHLNFCSLFKIGVNKNELFFESKEEAIKAFEELYPRDKLINIYWPAILNSKGMYEVDVDIAESADEDQ